MNRCIGEFPKIGIRPTIDGRVGALDTRGGLEEQTRQMAQSAKKLIEENVFYADGSPVKVVVPDFTIGRVAESAKCEALFQKEGVSITLTVTPCWCYGSETMDTNPLTIKGVWGFNGTERPGAVYLASVLATHTQKGFPAFGIYGHDVQNADETNIPDDVSEKILRFARASIAVKTMQGKSYLQIGSICMGIGGSIIDSSFIESYLGMRVESVDEVEILRRIDEEIYDKDEYEKCLKWTLDNCKEGFDMNPSHVKKSDSVKKENWEFIVKMYLIIKDLMNGNPKLKVPEERLGHNAIAAGFQGQRQWTDHWPNCDYPEAILNSSFDYTGKREPYILATENDVLNGLSMLFGKLLTGRPQMFSDVRTYWSGKAVKKATDYSINGKAKEADGFLHLINSGASALDWSAESKCSKNGDNLIKKWWNVTDEDIEKMLKATSWCAADDGSFRGGGFSSQFVTNAEMPVTMFRLNLVKGLGPVLQIAEGWTVKLPDNVNKILWDRTNGTWPCTWFAPRIIKNNPNFNTAYDVMNNWGANHGAISYGHIGADMITLASMLRIPVSMHNVDESSIFRPSAWASFGTDKEGSDYRACGAYGPMYGKY